MTLQPNLNQLLHLGIADNLLFSCLGARDLVAFSKISRQGHESISAYRNRAYSINKLLSPYFGLQGIDEFRAIQSLTGALISGSTALQFFDRSFYKGSDLDVYVEKRYSAELALFLQRIGYTFMPRKNQTPRLPDALNKIHRGTVKFNGGLYSGRGIADVYDFRKGEKKIQLIAARSCPMDIILSFHSTVVMNVITARYAFALYPRLTFIYRQSLVCPTPGSDPQPALEKYRQRGWRLITQPTIFMVTETSYDFRALSRFIGDRRCWTVKLPLPETQTLEPETIFTNTWRLCYRSQGERSYGRMRFLPSRVHPCLRYRYTTAECIDYESLEYEWAAICATIPAGVSYDAALCQLFQDNERVDDPLRCIYINPSDLQVLPELPGYVPIFDLLGDFGYQ
ncbi:hypothetical protein C8J56DRAFT_1140083 [Mycena floridula]|nr:hypothetical protein C8J56DRAFT_1140083 [Mycena floridula]